MATKISPDLIRSEIATFQAMWNKNPDLVLPDLDISGYRELVQQFQNRDSKIKELDMDRDIERVAREDIMITLSGYHTRLRSVTRGVYGPNSAQMNQAGLVRKIDRKVARRTAADTTSTNA
jgi:hypothetical protein